MAEISKLNLTPGTIKCTWDDDHFIIVKTIGYENKPIVLTNDEFDQVLEQMQIRASRGAA